MSSEATDVLSELLASQLHEEELRRLASEYEAGPPRLKALQELGDPGTRETSGHDVCPLTPSEDARFALNLQIIDAQAAGDALFAQSLQLDEASRVAQMQYAQKVAAMERSITLDAEFAKKLREVESGGRNITNETVSILGKRAIDDIIAADPNDKGKRKAKVPKLEPLVKRPAHSAVSPEASTLTSPYPLCEICFEPCIITNSPLTASLSANSSNKLPFGLRMPCPNTHAFCIGCLTSYLKSKLDPDDSGKGSRDFLVFPIRCPGCSAGQWPEGIPDVVAEKVLDTTDMVIWHHQKLLDSMPRYYCPNPRCSALIQAPEDATNPRAECPACDSSMCITCRVAWHSGITCKTYQALPADERSPEDRLVLELAKAHKWRRCPNCLIIVELTVGCNHMTCRCKTEFCFKCGALWTGGRCSRVTQCALWSEEMLLEEGERQRDRDLRARQEGLGLPNPEARDVPPVRPEPQAVVIDRPRPSDRGRDNEESKSNGLGWILNHGLVNAQHKFTSDMISKLECGYCNVRLNSAKALKYHLENVKRHAVYACCGQLFGEEHDYERHTSGPSLRSERHQHQIRRDGPARRFNQGTGLDAWF